MEKKEILHKQSLTDVLQMRKNSTNIFENTSKMKLFDFFCNYKKLINLSIPPKKFLFKKHHYALERYKKIYGRERYKIFAMKNVGNAAIQSQPNTFDKRYFKFFYQMMWWKI